MPVPLDGGDGMFEPFYKSQCPTDGDWATKKPLAIWRGSTTGGIVEGRFPDGGCVETGAGWSGGLPQNQREAGSADPGQLCVRCLPARQMGPRLATPPPAPDAEDWRLFHRQRLVNYSRQHTDAVDAAFTAYLQCSPDKCAEMEREYGPAAPNMPWEEQARHKYMVRQEQ